MDAFSDFPYLLDGPNAEPPGVPALAPVDCPRAAADETVLLLKPRSRPDLLRAVAMLKDRSDVRCLLLAPPARNPEGCVPILPADLRNWAREAAARLERPVTVMAESGATCRCGARPCCQGEGKREQEARLSGLSLRSESLATALEEAFPGLSPRNRELLQAWAHRPEPGHPNCPITQVALGRRFRLSARQVSRILTAAEADNPTIYARLQTLRAHRLRPTGAYQVRT